MCKDGIINVTYHECITYFIKFYEFPLYSARLLTSMKCALKVNFEKVHIVIAPTQINIYLCVECTLSMCNGTANDNNINR